MAFRFNFLNDSSEAPAEPALASEAGSAAAPGAARELEYQEPQEAPACEAVQVTPAFRLLKSSVSAQASAALLGTAELAVSDLVPGRYEGGFKLWECAVDLAAFLARRWGVRADSAGDTGSCAELAGKRVLELGCGHGLPGILAALLGAEAHFQDYNSEVLQRLTMPNLAANLAERVTRAPPHHSRKARFFAGDWAALPGILEECGLAGTYDFVLSTDTIYSRASQAPLLRCLQTALRPGGVAFIGAKAYYFGVGGSAAEFKRLATDSGCFELRDGERFGDGASNVREVFLLERT